MKILFCLAILFVSTTANSQVKFENLSLNEALKQASTSGKILFIQFESDACKQCNEVADKAFAENDLQNKIEGRFIPLKLSPSHPDRENFSDRFNPRRSFGTFFISGDGELLHVYPASSTIAGSYITEADKALSKLNEGKATLAELEKEWNNNPGNIYAMEATLSRRSALGLPTDSLLEVYVRRLPKDSFSSQRNIVFILKQAPNLFSKINSAIKRDQAFYTMAWYSMPLQERVSINNRIAAKSLAIAITERSRSKATAVANFHAGTHGDRFSKEAEKTYDKKMLDYFIGVKDTSAYLKRAVDYYDKYYMSESTEKLLQQDSIARSKAMQNSTFRTVKPNEEIQRAFKERTDPVTGKVIRDTIDLKDPKNAAIKHKMDSLIQIAKKEGPKSNTANGNPAVGRVVMQQSFSYVPTTQYFVNALNSGAWLIYSSTSDKKLLDKALTWAKRANEVGRSAEAMDTYARLLYKTGNREHAIEWQEKAIKYLKEIRATTDRFDEVLSKMKAGTFVVD